ncbi:MAG: succinylglutamate desuccinylase/aspartoacylase family protein, partial [Hyphomonadaceae bacterium]|nr:succinylglutamate desuccinylase/aspartoacylase family protein [Hyphomonadaceae bacterium]
PDAALLEIRPEPGTTNDSPWFAFRIRATNARQVRLTLRYQGGHHRYQPKISRDGQHWQTLAPEQVSVAEDQLEARFIAPTAGETLLVAAQPLQTAAQALAAVRAPLLRAGFQEKVIGRSAEGRKLVVFERGAAPGAPLLVFIARQHPPETTGGEAFEAFVARLTREGGAGSAAVLVAPLANPDGFVRGHWRGNAAGVDLNRDWGRFATPEIAAIGARIEALSARHPLGLFIDFHSTQRDVVYAPPREAEPCGVAETALEMWQAELGEAAAPLSRSHNAEGTTAKAWSLERFGAAGFTYEVGDSSDLRTVRAAAAALAEAVLRALKMEERACASP